MPSRVVGGIIECMASIISPSLISSQRQIICPYFGLDLINLSLVSSSSFLVWIIPFLIGLKLSFLETLREEAAILAISSPIAGAAVNPGDWIPAAWIMFLVHFPLDTIKSSS